MDFNEIFPNELANILSTTTHVDKLRIYTDEKTDFLNEVFSPLFGDNVKQSLVTLIFEHAISVNGSVLNGSELSINGAKALWQDHNGTWSWRTHILHHGEHLSYEQAAFDFVCGLSRLRGPFYDLTLEKGQIKTIDFTIYDVCFASTVSSDGGCTTLTVCGHGDGSMNRTDPSTILFPNHLVQPDRAGEPPSDRCVVLYWLDKEGWHLMRADSTPAIFSLSSFSVLDTRVNLEYSQPWNRPSQPIRALEWMELEPVHLIQWFYCPGITCGICHVDPRIVLRTAIQKAKQALNDVPVSHTGNGSDINGHTMWVTPQYHTTFAQAIEHAEQICDQDDLFSKYESALFSLCSAYAGDGSFYSKMQNVFPDGIGFITFAKNKCCD